MNYEDVLQFWFSCTSKNKWFKNDQAFDDEIRRLFGRCWESACRGELFTSGISASNDIEECRVMTTTE